VVALVSVFWNHCDQWIRACLVDRSLLLGDCLCPAGRVASAPVLISRYRLRCVSYCKLDSLLS
jgi:hypothetical protein